MVFARSLDSGLGWRGLSHSQAGTSTAAIHVLRARQVLQARRPQSQVRESHVVCAAERLATTEEEKAVANRTVLDKFWRGRGIHDDGQRERLIRMAEAPEAAGDAAWLAGKEYSTVAEVVRVSQRILQLQNLLGGSGEIDLVWMLTKEPRLLEEDLGQLAVRLLRMRTSGGDADILPLLSNQPTLLLQDSIGQDATESAEQRVQAWSFGLVSDGDGEWSRHYAQLQEYVTAHGDAHVGFRSADDAELSRWAGKQRRDYKTKSLSAERYDKLMGLGFEFDGDTAEWFRWYLALKEATSKDLDSPTGVGGDDIYLTNWCSVQRIARRSKRLSEERVALLDSIGFDWTVRDHIGLVLGRNARALND